MVAISFFSIFKVNYSLFILDVIQLDKLVKQFNCILNVAQYTTVHHTLWSCFDSKHHCIEKSGKKKKSSVKPENPLPSQARVQREEVIKVHLTLIFELFPVYWDTSTWSISHGTIVFHVFHRLHLMVVIKYLLGVSRNLTWICSRLAVLNSSPRAPPPLCIFRMLLLSLQMFILFERKCPAKWTSQDIPPWFQFEANIYTYIPFKVHWSVQDGN